MISRQSQYSINFKQQHGLVTLIMSAVMVVVISLISVYAAQVSVMDQKIAGNTLRTKQAFQSAQSALDTAVLELNGTAVDDLLSLSVTNASADDTAITNELKSLNPDSAYANHQDLLNSGGTATVGQYHLLLQRDSSVGNNSLINATACGFANDVTPTTDCSNANQKITVKLYRTTLVPYAPPAPMVSLGKVTLDNGVTVANSAGTPPAAIWSGGVIKQQGATVSGKKYGNSSQIKTIGTGDKLFENFFYVSKTQMKARATTVNCQSGCTDADLLDNNGNPLTGVIWINTCDNSGKNCNKALNITSSFKLGTSAKPVLLIVDGNLEMQNSGASINGIVYTTQNFKNDNSGNAGSITGSLISEGNINITQNLTFNYDNTMMNAFENGQFAGQVMYTTVAGSWKDF